MKLRSVTKFDKRKTATLKTFDDDVMSAYCDVIVLFSIYGQFEVIRNPDSGCMAYKTFIFINSNFLSCRTKNPRHSSYNIALSKGTIFAKKFSFFRKNVLT